MATNAAFSQAELAKAVERERKQAGVRSLDLSFNELADMHGTGELHITTEYQRTFRWSEAKQSQFIESIILEMPLPPIYAVEGGPGRWELIDGLQRLSTYLHFRGQLDLPDREPPLMKDRDFLVLEGCDIVRELNGYTFSELPTAHQHRVRRATLRVEVVRQESNPRFAYYMFKRLNTGGEVLSDQEVRNCSIRLLGPKFIDYILRLSKEPAFQTCIEDITDEYRARMGDVELVLRFFAFKNLLHEFVHEIEPFLTGFMERVTDEHAENRIQFDYDEEERIFKKTFMVLANTIGAKASRRWVSNTYGGGFSMGHFEAFSLGLARELAGIPEKPEPELLKRLTAAMEEAKKDPDLKALTTGGGKNFRRLYERKIEIVSARLRAAL